MGDIQKSHGYIKYQHKNTTIEEHGQNNFQRADIDTFIREESGYDSDY